MSSSAKSRWWIVFPPGQSAVVLSKKPNKDHWPRARIEHVKRVSSELFLDDFQTLFDSVKALRVKLDELEERLIQEVKEYKSEKEENDST